MHRKLCERIKVVYFNEGGYRKRKAEVSEIYNAFYTSSKKEKQKLESAIVKPIKKESQDILSYRITGRFKRI